MQMQTATVYAFKCKKSGYVVKYKFKVKFVWMGNECVREFVHYGDCRDTCLGHLVEQLKREFPGTHIVIDRRGLCSKLWRTSAIRVDSAEDTYVRIHYEFYESSDTFHYDYKCKPDADPESWKQEYLRLNTAAGEYYRYLGENPMHGSRVK